MKFDIYTVKGRIIPAFFSIILPIMIFNHFYISEEFSKFVGGIMGAKILSNITISTVLLYFLSELGRFFGKNLFERVYFKEESYMPTTNFLLFVDNHFTKDHKSTIRNKICNDFGITLMSENEERENETIAR